MKQQVNKEHYGAHYGYVGRFASYHYQVKSTLALKPESVLEVGVGDGVFGHYLATQTPVAYTSVDIAADLKPDIVGSVTEIPCADHSFDVVCCFEVLEHIPYDQVPKALAELKRVARRGLVLSVPHFGYRLQLMLKLPMIPELTFAAKLSHMPVHVFDGEHYWELGKKFYSARSFRTLLGKYGTVTRDFVPFENQYHHFFVIALD